MTNQSTPPHIPVLKQETVSSLFIRPDGVYLDCTIGFGGHSEEIIKSLGDKGKLIGIDYDPYALEYSNQRLSKSGKNFQLFRENYFHFPKILDSIKIEKVDGILFDLGISSYQVDSGYKGLSYKDDSPLDMQLGVEDGITVKQLLKTSSEEEIANIIYNNSEERGSRRIAKSIMNYVKKNKMDTNQDLVRAIDEVVPKSFSKKVLNIFPNAKKKLFIIKGGDHSLSKKNYLNKMCKELDKIIKNII